MRTHGTAITALASLWLGLAPDASFADAAPIATYQFQDTLDPAEPKVPPLALVDPIKQSHFEDADVFGSVRRVLRLDGETDPSLQAGLVFDSNGLLSPSSYSIELIFSFDGESGWRRIVDVLSRTSDTGFYVNPQSTLGIYPVIGGPAIFTAGEFHHVVLTISPLKDDPTQSTAVAYLDGVEQLRAVTDLLNIDGSGLVYLFLDNNQGPAQTEFSDSRIALARFYNASLTDAEVLALYQSFVPPPSCPGDINGDRVINTTDLTLLLLRFGETAAPGSPAAAADLNADGVVNTSDLVLFLSRFGNACP